MKIYENQETGSSVHLPDSVTFTVRVERVGEGMAYWVDEGIAYRAIVQGVPHYNKPIEAESVFIIAALKGAIETAAEHVIDALITPYEIRVLHDVDREEQA